MVIFALQRLCDPVERSVDNIMDMSNLFENLASNFAGVVQYNKDNSPHATITIDEVCDIMVNDTLGPQIDRLAAVNELLLNQSKEKCLDYKYDKMVKEMQNTSWDSDVAEGGKELDLFFRFQRYPHIRSIFVSDFTQNDQRHHCTILTYICTMENN